MNIPTPPPQMDPWASGARASDVPIAEEVAFDDFGAAEPPAPNAAEIRKFLDYIGSGIHLVSIVPDGVASGQYFGDDAGAAERWATAQNSAGKGIYFSVNLTKQGLNKKPGKEDIVAARFCHCDIDPPKDGSPWDRGAILSELQQLSPKPCLVIDSGNGLQPLWHLDHAPTNWGPVEDINRRIASELKGDNCYNIDRLLRVPGTVNYPNAKKRANGRVATMATLAHVGGHDAICSLIEMAQAFPPRADLRPKDDAGEEFKGDIKLLTPDDLGFSQFSPLRSVIEHPAGTDRSADGLRAAGDMLRAGFTKKQVLGILLNPANKVSAHYLDQADSRRAALRTIEYADKDKAKPDEQPGAQHGPDPSGPPPIHELPPLSLSEWRARVDLAVPDYLMGHWLTTTTRCLLTATTGLGKTNLAIGIVLAVADGTGFLHWTGRRKARVLYIDGEMSRRLLRDRLLAEAARLGRDPSGVYALSREDVEGMPPLNTPLGQAWMSAFIDKIGGVDLIVIDNIMCLTAGDQKDPKVWQETMPWVLSLTKHKIGQIWIHHTGHDESRSYGDKAREWQMDTTIHLDRVKREDTDVSFSLKFDKARERTPATREDFAALNVMLIENEWRHTANKSAGQQSAKGDTAFKTAMDEALVEHGFDHHIPRGPAVRAVNVEHIEREFSARYYVDPKSKNPDEAIAKAFRRSLADGQKFKRIGFAKIGRQQIAWHVK